MKSAETGNTVRVHYTGRLDSGTVFDSSKDSDPLEFTIGSGTLIGSFENAVVGMTVGDTKTVTIPAADAYGDHRSELVIDIERSKFPAHIEPREGAYLNIKKPDGGDMNVIITTVNEDVVTLDANHPLAGQDLVFDIELVEIS